MKPGTEMEYKQGQTTLAIVENDRSQIYHPCAEVRYLFIHLSIYLLFMYLII